MSLNQTSMTYTQTQLMQPGVLQTQPPQIEDPNAEIEMVRNAIGDLTEEELQA